MSLHDNPANPLPEESEKKIKDEEHIVKMWEPFNFQVSEGYNYLKKGVVFTFFYYISLSALFFILNIWNRVAYGMRIKGRKNIRKVRKNGAVVVCNHTHIMDCAAIECALFPRRSYFTTLESNFRIPVIRHILKLFGGVPIPTSMHCMKEFFDNMEKALDDRDFVCFYPEGALHPYEKDIRTFKTGAFRTAVAANKAVIPAVIVFRKPRGLMRLYRRKPCMTLSFLEPVYADENEDTRDEMLRLKDVCYEKMKIFAEESYRKMA